MAYDPLDMSRAAVLDLDGYPLCRLERQNLTRFSHDDATQAEIAGISQQRGMLHKATRESVAALGRRVRSGGYTSQVDQLRQLAALPATGTDSIVQRPRKTAATTVSAPRYVNDAVNDFFLGEWQMRITPDQALALESRTPPTAEVQERARRYMEVAQLSIKEFAARVNYGTNSMGWFLNGKYLTVGQNLSDIRIRRALTDFMDAFPVEIATRLTGHLHETGNVRVMRHWFDRCLARQEMAFAYGPPGAQKTFVAQHLVAEHNLREIPKNGHGTRAFYVYCSEQITPRELLKKMVYAAAVPSRQTILGLTQNLGHHLSKRRTLFVLDEAQHLSIPCLEIVRELNDCEPHAGILLTGSHKLLNIFQERAAELEQWNSRIAQGVELPGIETHEAAGIVELELGTIPTDRLQTLLRNSHAKDGYRNGKQYLSARRLFRQIADIKSDPRFTNPQLKESAA